MQCAWCQNPESISPEPQRLLQESLCIGCLECVPICPETSDDSNRPANPVNCLTCGRCVAVCPTDTRHITGQQYSIDQLVDIALRDQAFYRGSGGVTFGGGESLMQWQGVRELADRLREKNIDVCLDTCAAVSEQITLEIPHHFDRLLVDLKLITPDEHRKWTGVDNALVLAAVEYFAQTMADRMTLSVPVIPMVHSETELIRIAQFVTKLSHIPSVRLLPYEPFGESKYPALGQPTPDFSHDTGFIITLARQIFMDYGINLS